MLQEIEKLKKISHVGAQDAEAEEEKPDMRKIKSVYRLFIGLLDYAEKTLNDTTKNGIKRKLHLRGLRIDQKTAKKYFDEIQAIIDKK